MSNTNEISAQYGFSPPAKQTTDMVEIEQARAMHEVQASMAVAKRFPRDPNQAFANVINACKRPSLAEQAKYAFPRGNTVVTGASIKLMKVIAQSWGNILFGVRELSNAKGVSVMQAFAWDLETNLKAVKEFQVPHKRYTKSGSYDLIDQRDIYEAVANNGARRLRACLEDILPPDVVEAAEEQCEKTLKGDGKEPIESRIKKLILAFDEFGIKVSQIEKRLGHKLEAAIETELVTLRAIYKSIKDGMAKREEFFDFGSNDEQSSSDSSNKSESMAKILNAKKNKEQQTNESNEELKNSNAPQDKVAESETLPEEKLTAASKEAELTQSDDLAKVINIIESAKNQKELFQAMKSVNTLNAEDKAKATAAFNDKQKQLGEAK